LPLVWHTLSYWLPSAGDGERGPAVYDVILLAVLLAGLVPLGLSMSKEDERDYRAVAAWAQAHGWDCFRSGNGGRWTAPLPERLDKHVKSRVEGVLRGHAFTLVRAVTVKGGAGWGPVFLPVTVVVVHLPSAYPAVEINSRLIAPRSSATDVVGHAEFDRKFRINKAVPGGLGMIIPRELAEAHIAGTVPLWSVRNRELICVFKGKLAQLTRLDAAVDRAVQVVDLLGVSGST
jgi:hypothetical protein